VSSNKSLSQREILRFLASNKDWIEKSVAQAEAIREKYPPKSFRSGEAFPYLGADYRLRILPGDAPRIRFANEEILFYSPLPEKAFSDELRQKYFKAFQKSYRQVAESIMGQRIQYFSQQMQLFPKKVQFRGQKTIWGSCSPDNKISLNFKLIVAPIQVVDYVLIHELAHIRHKDHSSKFWALVEQHTPHRHFSREWLREHSFKADFLSKKSELNEAASRSE
jgi:predicted metal-dependent hydrolase